MVFHCSWNSLNLSLSTLRLDSVSMRFFSPSMILFLALRLSCFWASRASMNLALESLYCWKALLKRTSTSSGSLVGACGSSALASGFSAAAALAASKACWAARLLSLKKSKILARSTPTRILMRLKFGSFTKRSNSATHFSRSKAAYSASTCSRVSSGAVSGAASASASATGSSVVCWASISAIISSADCGAGASATGCSSAAGSSAFGSSAAGSSATGASATGSAIGVSVSSAGAEDS